MQKKNSVNPVNDFVLFPIPAEAFYDAGISASDKIRFGVCDGAVIIERADDEDDPRDGGYDPIDDENCDGDCAHCPCRFVCEDCEVDGR